jgi:hypothetical protein
VKILDLTMTSASTRWFQLLSFWNRQKRTNRPQITSLIKSARSASPWFVRDHNLNGVLLS